MGMPDIRNANDPVGPLRDKEALTIGADDFSDPAGFICQATADGNLTYTTEGGHTLTEAVKSGDFVNVAGIPVILTEISGTSTVASVVIGRL